MLQRLLLDIYSFAQRAGILDLPVTRRAFEACYCIYKTRLEARNIAIARRFVRAGDLVVDVGANIGVLTDLFARWVGPSGRVIAIEPEPINIAALQRRMKRSDLAKIVQIVPAAASDCNGRALLRITPHHAGDHHLVAADNSAGDTIEVDRITLDSLLNAHNKRCPSLLKIDVQGAELPVLRGAQETLSRCRPALLIEVDRNALIRAGSNEQEIARFLDALGYVPHDLRTGQRLCCDSILLPPGCEYADLLFTPNP